MSVYVLKVLYYFCTQKLISTLQGLCEILDLVTQILWLSMFGRPPIYKIIGILSD